ncbi:MAG: hypothetical protein J6Y28_06930 [Acholeplasmatales bacterium]|nr:hypothetical protein [Acholeplasmatales bacterium]
MKDEILRYLGYKDNNCDESISNLIDDCLEELDRISNFSYVYLRSNTAYDFLNKPDYINLLEGSTQFILCATTLGYDVDKKIKHYLVTDKLRALVLDACASVYLVDKADKFEESFGEPRTFRFCPGYENTPLSDNKIILELLKDVKPKVSTLDSLMLSPNKSMVGIIGLGVKKEKNCNTCMFNNRCSYRKENKLCSKK